MEFAQLGRAEIKCDGVDNPVCSFVQLWILQQSSVYQGEGQAAYFYSDEEFTVKCTVLVTFFLLRKEEMKACVSPTYAKDLRLPLVLVGSPTGENTMETSIVCQALSSLKIHNRSDINCLWRYFPRFSLQYDSGCISIKH